MYKAVFCDLDGTLFDSKGQIQEMDLLAIKALQAKGCLFVPCTGRVPFSLGTKLEELAAISPYLIGNSGAIIQENGEYLSCTLLSKRIKEAIIKDAVFNKRTLCIYTLENTFFYNSDLMPHKRYKVWQGTNVNDEEVLKLIDCDIAKINYVEEDDEKMMGIKADILARFGSFLEAFHSFVFLEIGNKNVDKGIGIRAFCQKHHILLEETIGIGDTNNDSAMLAVVGLSACPANAQQLVKDNVNYIACNDNSHGAVKEIIERFVL